MAQYHLFSMYNIALGFYLYVDKLLQVETEKFFWLVSLHFISFGSQIPFRH